MTELDETLVKVAHLFNNKRNVHSINYINTNDRKRKIFSKSWFVIFHEKFNS